MSRDAPLKILIADAEPSVKQAFRLFLGKDGSDVLDAEDGERALFIARTIPLDLLLADALLPKIGALDLLRAIRIDETPRVRALPFVILASDASADLTGRARTIGATEVLQKPLTTASIAALLRRAQRRRSAGSSSSWSSVQLPAERAYDDPSERKTDPSGLKPSR